MNTYQIQTTAQLSVTFVGSDGVTPIDPDDVTLSVQDPTGTETTYPLGDLTHPSTGVYTYDLLLSLAGPWLYNFQATGDVVAATGDQYLNVAETVFA